MSCNSAKEMLKKLCTIYEKESSNNDNLLLQTFYNYKIDKVAPCHTVGDETMMGNILSSLADRSVFFDCLGINP
ncbi:hypothetical protein PR048_012028 [Dryococelus australis]|uniref:Uncharacterized protein n=1 Tax=Dryococelus australis TaxID=614101 RepID=A0ABQ9HN86_9NEOP|nr:hypothetical protein PR048_012028 [Dryococelus australis]